MSTPLHIAVEYELSPDCNHDKVIAGIRTFVDHISSSGLGVSYKSLRRPEGQFLHFIRIDDEETLKELQSKPFFSEFAQLLKPNCSAGPTVSKLSLIAETS